MDHKDCFSNILSDGVVERRGQRIIKKSTFKPVLFYYYSKVIFEYQEATWDCWVFPWQPQHGQLWSSSNYSEYSC